MSRIIFYTLICSILAFSSSYAQEDVDGGEITGRDWSFHYYSSANDSTGHLLVVEKRHQRLTLYTLRDHLEAELSFPCATGENGGNKLTSGDSRTPEGIYFITEIYEDKKITIFGSRAFHLDYPNVFDRQAGRQGNGIFIHGTNKNLVPNSTNGCITLDNHDLDQLAPYLTVQNLPILIVDSLAEPADAEKMVLSHNDENFLNILKQMAITPGKVAAENISRLYFLRQGGQAVASLSYTEFDGGVLQYRHQQRSYLAAGISRQWLTLQSFQHQETSPTLIARLPLKERHMLAARGPAVIKPIQTVQPTESRAAEGLPPEEGQPALPMSVQQPIIAEPPAATSSEPPPTPWPGSSPATVTVPSPGPTSRESVVLESHATAEPLQLLAETKKMAVSAPTRPVRLTEPVAAVPPADSTGETLSEIIAFLEKWRSAWAGKDIHTYLDCYHPSFTSDGLDLNGWRARKSALNNRYRYIDITLGLPAIEFRDGFAVVTFVQEYQSDQYRSKGVKTLHLRHDGQGWKIHREGM